MAKKKSIEEIQKQINSISKENLTIIEYNGGSKPCKIICNTCGKEYKISQYGNLITCLKRGRGVCEDCFNLPKKRRDFENSLKCKFENEFIEILSFKGNTKPIKYKCKKCGTEKVLVKAKSLLKKEHLCNICFPPRYKEVVEQKKAFLKFISESEEWILEDDITTIGAHDKVTCKCKKCGKKSNKTMYLYLKGIGCGYCSGNIRRTTEDFKGMLDSDYELLSEYTGNHKHVLLKHLTCGFCYKVTPDAYLNQEQRCPKCSRLQSKGEKKIEKFLKEHNIEYYSEYVVIIENRPLRFDFYLPENNLYIEFQGIQHYEPGHFNQTEKQFQRQQENDNLKKQYYGERLLEIKYNEIEKINEILSQNLCISSTTILKGSTL